MSMVLSMFGRLFQMRKGVNQVITIRTAQKRTNHITIMAPAALGKDAVYALKDALTKENRLRSKVGKEQFSYEIKVVGPDPRPTTPLPTERTPSQGEGLGNELDKLLGAEVFKELGQDLAMVIAQHGLTKEPEICEKVFRYMSFVIRGWNSV